MKHQNTLQQNRPANPFGTSQSTLFHVLLTAAFVTVIGFAALAQETQAFKGAFEQLKPGDILYADSGDAVNGGFIIKVDPTSGEQTVISSGGNLIQPFDVAVDIEGQILVSDTGLCCTLIRIDPGSGKQSVITDNSHGTLGLPVGIALARDGDILVANTQAILRVNPATGDTQIVSSSGYFGCPLAIALAENGDLFVANMAFPAEILRVDPRNGAQTVLSRGSYLKNPQSIVAEGADIYVTDVATSDGNFGVGRVIHVDSRTGAQKVVSEGGCLVGPVGIAVDASGQIVVGDPYTINPESPDLYDGGIIRIDPLTGSQTLIARGHGSFVNPRGLAIVQSGAPHQNQVTGKSWRRK